MSATETRQAIESILMVADSPVDPSVLAQLLEVPKADVEALCDELAAEYEAAGRGFILARVAGGYRFQSHPDLAPYVERFVLDGQTSRLSSAALETLAIVAYKQPISRMQIAAIRGVNVDGVLRTLQQRGYVDEISRDSGPGNAVLFGTTDLFLERVGLNSTADLPPLAEFVPGADVVEALEDGLRPDPVEPPAPAADSSPDAPAADDGAESADSTVAPGEAPSAPDGEASGDAQAGDPDDAGAVTADQAGSTVENPEADELEDGADVDDTAAEAEVADGDPEPDEALHELPEGDADPGAAVGEIADHGEGESDEVVADVAEELPESDEPLADGDLGPGEVPVLQASVHGLADQDASDADAQVEEAAGDDADAQVEEAAGHDADAQVEEAAGDDAGAQVEEAAADDAGAGGPEALVIPDVDTIVEADLTADLDEVIDLVAEEAPATLEPDEMIERPTELEEELAAIDALAADLAETDTDEAPTWSPAESSVVTTVRHDDPPEAEPATPFRSAPGAIGGAGSEEGSSGSDLATGEDLGAGEASPLTGPDARDD